MVETEPQAPAIAGSVTVDSREPQTLKDLALRTLKTVTVEALPSADFAIADGQGGGIGIERKTTPDFLASLSDRQSNGEPRLYNQLEKLVNDYQTVVLLIEGEWYTVIQPDKPAYVYAGNRKTGWTVAAMQMALLSLQQRYDVQVLYTMSMTETLETVRALAERARTRGVRVHGERGE